MRRITVLMFALSATLSFSLSPAHADRLTCSSHDQSLSVNRVIEVVEVVDEETDEKVMRSITTGEVVIGAEKIDVKKVNLVFAGPRTEHKRKVLTDPKEGSLTVVTFSDQVSVVRKADKETLFVDYVICREMILTEAQ